MSVTALTFTCFISFGLDRGSHISYWKLYSITQFWVQISRIIGNYLQVTNRWAFAYFLPYFMLHSRDFWILFSHYELWAKTQLGVFFFSMCFIFDIWELHARGKYGIWEKTTYREKLPLLGKNDKLLTTKTGSDWKTSGMTSWEARHWNI